MSTRAAQARIRHVRKRSRGGSLVRAVERTVAEYRERYPDTTADEIVRALSTVAERCRRKD